MKGRGKRKRDQRKPVESTAASAPATGVVLGRDLYLHRLLGRALVTVDARSIAEDVIVYKVAMLHMGSHAIVSQQAYICTATHDVDDPAFRMIAAAIRLGRYSWVCARASVLPGMTLGEGAVLGLAGVASKDLEPWQVYAGNPAKRIKKRRRVG